MKKLKIKRHELPAIIEGLIQIKGMKDYRKAITLGDDRRTLRKEQEKTEESAKMCKPSDYDALEKEFRELKAKKAKEFGDNEGEIINDNVVGAHVMLVWPKAAAWNQANINYQEAINKISNEEVEITLQTDKLDSKDFDMKLIDMKLAEVLSYFR